VRATVVAGRLEPPVTVVLEGRFRAGAEESDLDGVAVVHAPGEGDDTIATSVWAVLTGDVVIDAETETTTSSTVWLSGGTAGTSALLLCTITTAGSRTFERTIRLRVVAAE
jgi:hypothetical protein